jgi:hypothetical protein
MLVNYPIAIAQKPNKTVYASSPRQLFKAIEHLLRRHPKEHYQCPFCKQQFYEKIILAVHIGQKH